MTSKPKLFSARIFSAVAGSMQAQYMIFERVFDENLAQGGSQFTGAHQLFESLNKFSKLPQKIEF